MVRVVAPSAIFSSVKLLELSINQLDCAATDAAVRRFEEREEDYIQEVSMTTPPTTGCSMSPAGMASLKIWVS